MGLSGQLISEAVRCFERFRNSAADEVFYEYVGAEIDSGYKNQGLYLKCFATCEGDEKKTEAKYIRERVKQVKLVFNRAQKELSQSTQAYTRSIVSQVERTTKSEPSREDPYENLSMEEKLELLDKAKKGFDSV